MPPAPLPPPPERRPRPARGQRGDESPPRAAFLECMHRAPSSPPTLPPHAEDAFERFVRRSTPFVSRVCGRVLRCPADAADATQLVFLRCLRHWPHPRTAGDAWLATIALNVCRDLRRSAQRRRHHEALAGRALPASGPVGPSAVDEGPLAALTPEERALLHLRFVEGMTTRAVAAATQLTPAAVDSRIRRLRARLRRRPWLPGGLPGSERQRAGRLSATTRAGAPAPGWTWWRWAWARGRRPGRRPRWTLPRTLVLGLLLVLAGIGATARSLGDRGWERRAARVALSPARSPLGRIVRAPQPRAPLAEEGGRSETFGLLVDPSELQLPVGIPNTEALTGTPLPAATAPAWAAGEVPWGEPWADPVAALRRACAGGGGSPGGNAPSSAPATLGAVLQDPLPALAFVLAHTAPQVLAHAHVYLPQAGLPPLRQLPRTMTYWSPYLGRSCTSVVVGVIVEDDPADALARRIHAAWGEGLQVPASLCPATVESAAPDGVPGPPARVHLVSIDVLAPAAPALPAARG